MSEFTQPLEDLSGSVRDYVDLKVEEVKLRTAKGLSLAVSKILATMALIGVASVVLLSFAFGLVLLLGEKMGSYAVAALIAAAVLLLLFVVLFLLRKRLFEGRFVRLFAQLFFGGDNDE